MNTSFVRLVLLVTQRDYLRTVRRRGFIAGTLLLPVALIALMGLSAFLSMGGTNEPFKGPLLVVNESQVALSADPALTPHVVLVDRAAANAQIADGSAHEYFLVPAEWPTKPQVRVVVPDDRQAAGGISALTRQGQGQAEVDLLLRVSLLRGAGLPDSALPGFLSTTSFSAVTVSGEPVNETSIAAGFLLPYVFTLIFVMSIFITSGYLLQSVTEEKENRVVEIVLSSIPALPLMAGKVLGLGAAGLTQVIIWLVTAVIAIPLLNQQFSLDVTLSPAILVLAVVIFCLGYIGYGAIFAAVGAIAPGAREGQQYSSFFGFFAVVPLIATPLFLSDPQSPIIWALALFPLTAPAASLELLAIQNTPWLIVGASLLSQLVFLVVATVAAGRIFRATLLLYGVRPSVGRILGALLGRA